MDYHYGSKGPVALQVHKWENSQLQFDLSQFCEALVSPTWTVLLLHSYQDEALLIPLVAEDVINFTPKTSDKERHGSRPFKDVPHKSTEEVAKLDCKKNYPPVFSSNNEMEDLSSKVRNPKSNDYAAIYDVKSFAWGVCSDSYNRSMNDGFGEILFVCGSDGVFVHAFRKPNTESIATGGVERFDEFESDQGTWVTWGPVSRLSGTDFRFDVDNSIQPVENSFNYSRESDMNGKLRNRSFRSWFCSFYTTSETVLVDGNIYTRFPKLSSFPCSANVVSCRILDSDFSLWNYFRMHEFSDEAFQFESVSVASKNLHNFSEQSCIDAYKCSKIFSNKSHNLVGFFLHIMDSNLVVKMDSVSNETFKDVVLIARLSENGIQWISIFKLGRCANNNPTSAWIDFCFVDDLVVCLNEYGSVSLHMVMTGKEIAIVDIYEAYSLNLNSKMRLKTESSLGTEEPAKGNDQAVNNSSLVSENVGRRRFKKLLVSDYASQWAAIDVYGIIYVMWVDCGTSGRCDEVKKRVIPFQHSALDMFSCYYFGGYNISQAFEYTSCILKNGGRPPGCDFLWAKFHPKYHKPEKILSGFCFTGDIPCGRLYQDANLFRSRDVILLTERFRDGDSFCFSPFGITHLVRTPWVQGPRNSTVVHRGLWADSNFHDDTDLNPFGKNQSLVEKLSVGESVGCFFQGWLYLVTPTGISIILPSLALAASFLPVEAIGYKQHYNTEEFRMQAVDKKFDVLDSFLEKKQDLYFLPWKIEILDRMLLYEGHLEADTLCQENEWNLKVSRIRRLQLALFYLNYEEIERSLEMLDLVNVAEEGVLRLLLAAVYMMLKGDDYDVSCSSRLLAIATHFATKMIRKYASVQVTKRVHTDQKTKIPKILCLPSVVPKPVNNKIDDESKLHEMSRFLEIVRRLQHQIDTRPKKAGDQLVENNDASILMDGGHSCNELQLSVVSADVSSLHLLNQHEVGKTMAFSTSSINDNLALVSKGLLDSECHANSEVGISYGKIEFPLENAKDMIGRWKLNSLDSLTVVKDALISGRLPLAVLQLHLHERTDSSSLSNTGRSIPDTFNEVRHMGKSISYDLFLKGEIRLAIATLHKLGEDVERCLKQLLFGTLRKSLRIKLADEMKQCGYLGPFELKIMEKALLIERLYPSTNFWTTFQNRKEVVTLPAVYSHKAFEIQLLLSSSLGRSNISCGEVDGVILGSWSNIGDCDHEERDAEESGYGGYWVAAAVWYDSWDQRTIDRIVLDQPFLMGVHVIWESQLDYFVCRNNWQEVRKLIDLIPTSAVMNGTLRIVLNESCNVSDIATNDEIVEYKSYICSNHEVNAACIDVSDVTIFKFPASFLCSLWLRMLMEQDLAKKLIFTKDCWDGTAGIVALLARSGFLGPNQYKSSTRENNGWAMSGHDASDSGTLSSATMQSFHELVIHHCVQHCLPNLLDLYFEYRNLIVDRDSIRLLQKAAGNCQWAQWLCYSMIKGCEYDASFCNARSILSCSVLSEGSVSILERNDIIHTVDDIAETGSEMAALATLMYAPDPIQNCLSFGSVRHSSSSAQCTLESLKHTLQQFPTLRRSIVAAGFEQDIKANYLGFNLNSVLSSYLAWRDSIFMSSTHDTSLLQMLPCWLPKAVRKLIQIYMQGPLGWQSLMGTSLMDINSVSWEATIQKLVMDELFSCSLKDSGVGFDHHLHRGRAFAAFNQILIDRVEKIKSERQSSMQSPGQSNVQLDVQTVLAPLCDEEEALLSTVIPLAITHFEDSKFVASCIFLMELCGVPTTMLRIDVAALRRISTFYKTRATDDVLSPISSGLNLVSHDCDAIDALARSLADECLHKDYMYSSNLKSSSSTHVNQSPSRAYVLVLQHLEKASLPLIFDGKTCGSWLSAGDGNGAELRSKQKAAGQKWSLVSTFCRMHLLPLSTKYLALLAKDNDWVGFLSEAQIGRYSFDTIYQVAANGFSDLRLRAHVLNVLSGIYSKKKPDFSSQRDYPGSGGENLAAEQAHFMPPELFRVLAESEKHKNSGGFLLKRSKELSWSVLAMIASCFSDVSPLLCLKTWLEIAAARETTSIKVNDVASRVAINVGAAVRAANQLPIASKGISVHFNRYNPKRRRLMETLSCNLALLKVVNSDHSSSHDTSTKTVAQALVTEERSSIEALEQMTTSSDSDELSSLTEMVAVLCEQRLFLPLLRAFEMFLPSCSLLPFIRALQAFSQMRLSEAVAHLDSFSARMKEDTTMATSSLLYEGMVSISWISSTAVKAANAVLMTCPSSYEKRGLFELLAGSDFGDGGSAAANYKRNYIKIDLAEQSLRKGLSLHLDHKLVDDVALLEALENNGRWKEARIWASHIETNVGPWKSATHHVTETQAESLVSEWKEFLWDVPEERVALWSHCQTLFITYSFPPLQAGLFFLKHAEAVEKDIPARELLELLLLSLQWLSGMITQTNPVYPMHLLREIETRIWLLAVESEAQMKKDRDFTSTNAQDSLVTNMIDKTANFIAKMDNHMTRMKSNGKSDVRDINYSNMPKGQLGESIVHGLGGMVKSKRRIKGQGPFKRLLNDNSDRSTDVEESASAFMLRNDSHLPNDSMKMEVCISKWEERVGQEELKRAVLSLLEFGQITASKQLQYKFSPSESPSEFKLIDIALHFATIAPVKTSVTLSMLDEEIHSLVGSYFSFGPLEPLDPLQILEKLTKLFSDGNGRGLCQKIIAVTKAAIVLGLSFSEAFNMEPVELLRLLSLKAQDSYNEAALLIQTHIMSSASIAQILAESFLKGLLAAHRGGYIESQREEGPAPLLWRFSDFLKWAKFCPSEPEVGHALMRLVVTGQDIPHACEVELLILSHHFYKSSACLDGVELLVTLATTRVEAYVLDGDFTCLARLITGVGDFHALNNILGILIENGKLDLLLHKYSSDADAKTGAAEAVRGFTMAVLTSLNRFKPDDLDSLAMVYNHFDMKHETATLLESRAWKSCSRWLELYNKEQNEDLLESMRYFIGAAEVYSSIDAGNKTHKACAQASLVSLQIRMPDSKWLNLTETNARRLLVDQSRFQEALTVAEAYGLNQPTEWGLVLWDRMVKPDLIEDFVAEFVAVLPLHSTMLIELARFYRTEVTARGDQSQFSAWLSGSGVPAEFVKHLAKSFRCLLKRTRDLRLRLQLASTATGFSDIVEFCNKMLDKVPDHAGPLVLRKGHGGAYLPLM